MSANYNQMIWQYRGAGNLEKFIAVANIVSILAKRTNYHPVLTLIEEC